VQDSHRWDYLLRSWSPGTDRLSTGGWIIVAAYGLAAFLCLRRARRLPPAERAGWLVPGLLLLGLGIGRLLDLPDLLTVTVRNSLVRNRAYESRRLVQLPFLALLTILSAAAAILLWRKSGQSPRPLPLRLAWLGTLLTGGLFFVRACSLHSVDRMLGREWFGVHLGGGIEFCCLLLVMTAALRRDAPP
jgi:hypothetical protein